ncbi:MAG: aldo/keto reductase [Anaerolineales bacterium]|nr:aldo/keto reductase [Anaerolineales bacterium]
MKYTRLGKTGLNVSRICLGMMTYGDPNWREWTLGEADCEAHVKRALELGINFFDTANVYSVGVSEEVTGRVLKKYAKRENIVLATKVRGAMSDDPNGSGLSRKHIMDQVDASLRRLGTDYIDLYQIHRWDYSVPIEETLEALHDVVKAGKVRYIGASSMFAWQFAKALYTADLHGWTRFVSMQNHYNIIYREEEREMNPLCVAEGVGIIPWSPLARGFATGKRTRGGERKSVRSQHDPFGDALYNSDSDFDVAEAVTAVSQQKGVSAAQVALAWMLSKPNIAAPIIGTTKLEHLEDAVKAVDIVLTDEEIAALEAPYRPHPVLGHN